jgi:hypothetical protein
MRTAVAKSGFQTTGSVLDAIIDRAGDVEEDVELVCTTCGLSTHYIPYQPKIATVISHACIYHFLDSDVLKTTDIADIPSAYVGSYVVSNTGTIDLPNYRHFDQQSLLVGVIYYSQLRTVPLELNNPGLSK